MEQVLSNLDVDKLPLPRPVKYDLVDYHFKNCGFVRFNIHFYSDKDEYMPFGSAIFAYLDGKGPFLCHYCFPSPDVLYCNFGVQSLHSALAYSQDWRRFECKKCNVQIMQWKKHGCYCFRPGYFPLSP